MSTGRTLLKLLAEDAALPLPCSFFFKKKRVGKATLYLFGREHERERACTRQRAQDRARDHETEWKRESTRERRRWRESEKELETENVQAEGEGQADSLLSRQPDPEIMT